MTNNEKELLDIIHQSSNPEKALITAIDLVMVFLLNCEAPQGTSFELHQEVS